MLARAIRAPLTARTPAVLLSRCSSSKPAASSSSSEEPLSAKEEAFLSQHKTASLAEFEAVDESAGETVTNFPGGGSSGS